MPRHTNCDPAPTLNPTCPSATAVATLVRKLLNVLHSDGRLPADQVADYLTGTWLPGLGINLDDPADTPVPYAAGPACQHRRVNLEFNTTVHVVATYHDNDGHHDRDDRDRDDHHDRDGDRGDGDGDGDGEQASYQVTDVVYSDQAISDTPTAPVFCMDCNRWLQTADEAALDAVDCIAGPLTNWPAGRIGSL